VGLGFLRQENQEGWETFRGGVRGKTQKAKAHRNKHRGHKKEKKVTIRGGGYNRDSQILGGVKMDSYEASMSVSTGHADSAPVETTLTPDLWHLHLIFS